MKKAWSVRKTEQAARWGMPTWKMAVFRQAF